MSVCAGRITGENNPLGGRRGIVAIALQRLSTQLRWPLANGAAGPDHLHASATYLQPLGRHCVALNPDLALLFDAGRRVVSVSTLVKQGVVKVLEIWLPLLGGFVLLIVGGELLVRGAVQVATVLGVSPLVIGLTLVGFGTSTPELVTSVQAALSDAPGIAYGNIVGSNIANVLLIVGIAALISPMAIASSALKRDGALMFAVAVVFAAIAFAMPLGRIVGLVFITALVSYVYLAFRQERADGPTDHGAVYDKSVALQEADASLTPPAQVRGALLISALIAIGGLVLVVVGGRFLVEGSVSLARGFGISETVIGLTIVAVGTSTPELVTSVIAGIKRQGDVAFGNIVGSNIYNILGIGGATALIAPGPVPAEIIAFDNLVMVGVSLALVAVAWTGLRIARWEGVGLLAGYAIYVYTIWP